MMNKIKQALLLLCALVVVVSIPVFLSKRSTIPADMPALSRADITANQEEYKRLAEEQAAKEKAARLAKIRSANFVCQTDEDCIIVDQDPCGCLIGPKGVVAINASRALEFTNSLGNVMAKACPEGEPSQEKECSPNARAVCRNKMCKIVY